MYLLPRRFQNLQAASRSLWQAAPDAAVFAITYIFIMTQNQSLSLLLNWTRLLFYLIKWVWYQSRDKALEAVSLTNDVKYGKFGFMNQLYVNVTILFAVVMSFIFITPIIIPAGIFFLLCLMPIMKFLLLVRVPEDFADTGGKIWMQVVDHLLWVMGFFFVLMLCICILRINFKADGGIITLLIIFAGAVFFFPTALWFIKRYNFEHLPLYEARTLADQEDGWGTVKVGDGHRKKRDYSQPEINFMLQLPEDYSIVNTSSWKTYRSRQRHINQCETVQEEQTEDLEGCPELASACANSPKMKH